MGTPRDPAGLVFCASEIIEQLSYKMRENFAAKIDSQKRGARSNRNGRNTQEQTPKEMPETSSPEKSKQTNDNIEAHLQLMEI